MINKYAIHFFFLLLISIGWSCQTDIKEVEVVDEEMPIFVPDSFELIFNYEDEFSESERIKLSTWIEQIYDATQKSLGTYPFDVYIHFYASVSSSRPVSFGMAKRKDGINSASLYVNPAATLENLMVDWTAPHELSHLSIPFLGKASKWFSEGYATFLSRQIMMDMGYYTQTSFDSLYTEKINEAFKAYSSDELTFIERSNELAANHQFSNMYWGSASFLFTIDKRLRAEQNKRFVDILVDYQECCRLEDRYLVEVIHSFDELIGEPWCSDLMAIYRNKSANEALESFR